jgi:hypothetical protein
MKKYLIVLAALSIIVAACKKSDPEPEPQNTSTPTSFSKFARLWNVGDGSGRVNANLSDYTSFEFLIDRTYVVTLKNATRITGTFTINADTTVFTLNGFGVLTVTTLSDNTFNFTLILNSAPATTVTIYSTSPSAPISGTSKTEKLCRGWKLYSRTNNGVPDANVNSLLTAGTVYAHVTLSAYGTYFTETFTTGQPAPTFAYRVWQWKDDSQTDLCTGVTTPDCTTTGNSVGGITFLGDTMFTHSGNNVVDRYLPLH